MSASALRWETVARCSVTRARAGVLHLPHASVNTPVFMPVGTQGTLKGITTAQLRDLDCQIMLGNTYHLGMRPGPETLQHFGGLHEFMNWDRALLTDSGGFQMVSLVALSEVTEEGVRFQSPHDGSMMMLSPEKSIELQTAIGADIMMQLDDVVSSTISGPRVVEAMHRSIRWLDRCIAAHRNPDKQNLFAIIQGGLDADLRVICLEEMIRRNLPGYAIGGLSGGEKKDLFWPIVKQCTDALPADKPRYLMGVGYAVDLVVCSALGVDMFDCVYPTRTARFGTALVRANGGVLQLRHSEFRNDMRPIDINCPCDTCRNYTRAYLHSVVTKEPAACHLVSTHNVVFQLCLMRDIRQSIIDDRFPVFIREFMRNYIGDQPVPTWITDALQSVHVTLDI